MGLNYNISRGCFDIQEFNEVKGRLNLLPYNFVISCDFILVISCNFIQQLMVSTCITHGAFLNIIDQRAVLKTCVSKMYEMMLSIEDQVAEIYEKDGQMLKTLCIYSTRITDDFGHQIFLKNFFQHGYLMML